MATYCGKQIKKLKYQYKLLATLKYKKFYQSMSKKEIGLKYRHPSGSPSTVPLNSLTLAHIFCQFEKTSLISCLRDRDFNQKTLIET
jgi:hypothetical protein